MNGDMPIDPTSNEELDARYAELVDANPEPASTEVQVRACVAPYSSSCCSSEYASELELKIQQRFSLIQLVCRRWTRQISV